MTAKQMKEYILDDGYTECTVEEKKRGDISKMNVGDENEFEHQIVGKKRDPATVLGTPPAETPGTVEDAQRESSTSTLENLQVAANKLIELARSKSVEKGLDEDTAEKVKKYLDVFANQGEEEASKGQGCW